jgi:hypothetical protein
MISKSIYQEIPKTYLYIKQHSITGLKYLGKTTNADPYAYNGSGKYWIPHIKKHGKEYIQTTWVSEPYFDTSIIEEAIRISIENDVVKSDEWANLQIENGIDGWPPGVKLSEDHKLKIGISNTGIKNGFYGKSHSNKTKEFLRKINLGKKASIETKKLLSIKNSGKNNPMYGKYGKDNPNYGKQRTEEFKKEASIRFSGKNNPMYGISRDNNPNAKLNDDDVKELVFDYKSLKFSIEEISIKYNIAYVTAKIILRKNIPLEIRKDIVNTRRKLFPRIRGKK